MSDRKTENAPAPPLQRSELARWDSEGGAGPLGPQQHDIPGAESSELRQRIDNAPGTIGQAVLVPVTMTRQERYEAAKAHVAALIGYYIHLGVFVAVMVGLFGINYAGGDPWWVQWPLIGWGLGILGHAYLVFSPRSVSMKEWQRRKIKEEIAKM